MHSARLQLIVYPEKEIRPTRSVEDDIPWSKVLLQEHEFVSTDECSRAQHGVAADGFRNFESTRLEAVQHHIARADERRLLSGEGRGESGHVGRRGQRCLLAR